MDSSQVRQEIRNSIKLKLLKQLENMMLGISYREKKPEKEGLKKQLNNVKPGLLNGEIETEKGGQRRGVKKQLNSVKPGLLNSTHNSAHMLRSLRLAPQCPAFS